MNVLLIKTTKETLAWCNLVVLFLVMAGNPVNGKTVPESVSLFLNQHCVDCHRGSEAEGGVDFERLTSQSLERSNAVIWQAALEQVVLGEMPPEGHDLPSEDSKESFLFAIKDALQQSGHSTDFFEKLTSPEFGNLVSHERLFSGEVTERAFSPSRLWRTSPNVFENVKQSYGVDSKPFRQPFVVDDKAGIKDYADLLLADSAVVDVLLMNAGNCADQLIDKRGEYKRFLELDAGPANSALRALLEEHFQRVVYRDPTAEETERYLRLYERSLSSEINGSPKALRDSRIEALRIALMAIMLHPESIYRIEIGLGPKDEFGRRRLSATETAFSIAFALTDQRPDPILMEAVKNGRLEQLGEVQSQLQRLLGDKEITKPRILRFFQEFFGYGHAHKVFKDEKRSGGFSYYGENYPDMYERDADFFVLNILEDDTDVLTRLLTSDEYYLLNRQTFRNTVYDFYLQNQADLDADQFPEEKQQELLRRLDLDHWGQLNDKYYLHNFNRGFNGSIRAIKQIVKEVRQWKNTTDEYKLLHGMQPLYRKYPMVYDLRDDEQDFLLPQPYRRPNRAGLLTHPAWLIAHSLNDSTDPIRRGKWIQERLLSGLVPDVPITVDATIPEDHNRTLRERLAGTERQECWRCHKKMNPLGYPFEIYDDFGRSRTAEVLDKLPKVKGEFPEKPIDAVGYLSGTGDPQLDGEVDDALDLINRLARSARVRQSFIRHAFRYFMGRNELLSDSQTLIQADRVYLESGGSFNALLTSLLTSDSFLYRR